MTYDNLLITHEDNCLILTINRPKALNAINQSVMEDLRNFFEKDAPNRTDYVGVIITGSGEKAFVAGADIKGFAGLNAVEGSKLSQYGHDTYFAIERFNKPVIAAVNGFALGGGCELAMACHLRIASDNARFGQPEVNLGLIPGYGGSQRLIQFIGKGKAMELLLTADMIGAEEAHRLGLVNKVVAPEELMEACKKMLQKIGKKGPVAIAKTISTINAYFDKQQNGFEVEVSEFGACMETSDFVEGASAFVEKRKANFTGK